MARAGSILLLSLLVLSGCQCASRMQVQFERTDDKLADNHRIEEFAKGVMTLKHVSIKSVDDLEIPAYLFTPIDSNGEALPTVIYLHGGEHGTFSSRYMRYVVRFINRNWNVLALDYRGSSGYGQAYYDLADYGGLEIDDALAARDWLVEQRLAPASKVALIGGSHGGYNTLMAIARGADGFAAGVDLFGPTDILYRVTSTPEENTNASDGDAARFAKMVGATVQENEQAYRARSPRFLAYRITAPILIIHGTDDHVVNIRESQWLVEAFNAAGKTNFEYRIVEGAHHGYPSDLFDPHREYAVEFLARFLDD